MLFNYIKIAIRNILRNKLHSFINIMGLAIGIASAVLLFLAVQLIHSYDKHHSKNERIYMVESQLKIGEIVRFTYGTSFAAGPALKDEYHVIEEFVRNFPVGDMFFRDNKGEVIKEDKICYADPQIFKVFDHEFIYGSPEDSLDSLHSIVLNKTLAKKYFGEENPVGKTLSRNNGIDYTVTGVFEDLSKKTIRYYSALIPMMDYAKEIGIERFNSREPKAFLSNYGSFITFILLNKNSDIKSITNDYERFRKKYISSSRENNNKDLTLVFEPLSDVFLNYRPSQDAPPIYNMTAGMLFLLALFILVVACINYMNLATAKSESRAMEVGVRKVMGANRLSLVRQFLCEAVIITITALLIALVLIELFLPSFNNLINNEISFSFLLKPEVFTELLIVIFFVGLLSGSYPALFLSAFLPVHVFRGGRQTGKSKARFRKLLVIVQFTLTIFIINFTFVFHEFINFWLNADLGFNKDNVLLIRSNDPDVKKAIPALKEKLLKNSSILYVSRALWTIGTGSWNTIFKTESPNNELVELYTAFAKVDFDFIDTMEIEVLEGRSFSREIITDRDSAVLVNEAFVKEMGWTDSPIGKRIQRKTGESKIIGVLKDFHHQALITKLRPIALFLIEKDNMDELPVTYIKIRPEDSKRTLEFIKNKWKELIPMYPFECNFLEDIISNQYEFPQRLYKIFIYFAFLCIFVSCLGLFGLSSFIAEKRTKEIGIRKVHGASVRNILFQMILSFIKPIFISGVIAAVISYYLIGQAGQVWIYRPERDPWQLYCIALCMVLIIALLTVSYHAVKAALTNPVKTLRYE